MSPRFTSKATGHLLRPLAAAALAGLATAHTAQAAPIQLSFTASFSTCSGSNCHLIIDGSQWGAVSGSFIYDPALSNGYVSPPYGYAPEMFSNNRVHTFDGTSAFSASLHAGSFVAQSTGIAPPNAPNPAYNGIAPNSGALLVADGQTFRSGDRLEFRDQSMNNISGGGLPAGSTIVGNPFGGEAGRLSLTLAWSLLDGALNSAGIPLDVDSIPFTPSVQSLNFGFFWQAAGSGLAQWVDYSGSITSFSSAPYTGGTPTPPPGGGGGTQPPGGGTVPEPASLALVGLGLAAAAASAGAARRRASRTPGVNPVRRPAA